VKVRWRVQGGIKFRVLRPVKPFEAIPRLLAAVARLNYEVVDEPIGVRAAPAVLPKAEGGPEETLDESFRIIPFRERRGETLELLTMECRFVVEDDRVVEVDEDGLRRAQTLSRSGRDQDGGRRTGGGKATEHEEFITEERADQCEEEDRERGMIDVAERQSFRAGNVVELVDEVAVGPGEGRDPDQEKGEKNE
tara:strand:- start:41549 stop:42130 length:582 start_codon:yes stop_codon:yes gene_type:complete